MSLTLPFPDLVFVPLDILTAEEQNEIVANYTYISNQFPIGANNIDFTTFNGIEVLLNEDSTLSGISKSYPFEITIIGIISLWGYAGGEATVSVRALTGNPTVITQRNGKCSGGDTTARAVVCSGKYSCEANTSYSFGLNISNGGGEKGDRIVLGILKRLS